MDLSKNGIRKFPIRVTVREKKPPLSIGVRTAHGSVPIRVIVREKTRPVIAKKLKAKIVESKVEALRFEE